MKKNKASSTEKQAVKNKSKLQAIKEDLDKNIKVKKDELQEIDAKLSEVEECEVESEETLTRGLSDSVQLYLQAIGKENRLSAKDEIELSRQISSGNEKQSKHACNSLVRANLRLVVSIAKKYSQNSSQIDVLDLIQEGNTGLIRAAEKYQAEFGYRFSTYASHWIKQSINKYVSEKKRLFRIPQHVLERLNKLKEKQEESKRLENSQNEDKEIIDTLNDIHEDVLLLHEIYNEGISLDAQVGNDDENNNLGELISDESQKTPEEEFYQSTMKVEIQRIIDENLDEVEKQIVELRYGLNPENIYYSMDQVSKMLDIAKDKIKRMEFKALRKMKINSGEKIKPFLSEI